MSLGDLVQLNKLLYTYFLPPKYRFFTLNFVGKILHFHHNGVCLRLRLGTALVQLPAFGQRTFDSF